MQENDAPTAFDATVAIAHPVDGGVELIVTTEGLQDHVAGEAGMGLPRRNGRKE